MLSIRGTNFIADWAYAKKKKCLIGEYTSAELNIIFKNLVLQALETKRIVSAKKVLKNFMLA